ncbi:forkhead box protein O1-like [Scleropages formosus]|uniref:forkhead box protein O1-like n=1 Tax=Scleropages formosus TaxID=113540 RepID=UPI0010FA8E3B|nr:forkhead box protein O1-like [Scleropages formosus]
MEDEEVLHIDPDFEPKSRPRSCTWPLPRPDISAVKQEGLGNGENQPLQAPPTHDNQRQTQHTEGQVESVPPPDLGAVVGVGGATPRKGASRRNPWGNQSYADLISQAIESSPEKRLTLAQIYDWIVNSVPYFKDKGDSNSSAGWKNSICHNLSLHSKFLRVHNESTGKSSWWILNPEGDKSAIKIAKDPRPRATSMDNSNKLQKSRRLARQAKQEGGAAAFQQREASVGSVEAESPSSSQSTLGPSSRSGLEDPDVWTGFRSRANSSGSTLSGRLSPIVPLQEDEDEPQRDGLLGGYTTSGMPTSLTEPLMEELDLIDGLTLMNRQLGKTTSATSSSFAALQLLQAAKPPVPLTQSELQSPVSQGRGATSNFVTPAFNSVLSPGSQGEGYRAHLSSRLEALLVSDSPPPSDIVMAQVEPEPPSQGSTGILHLGGSHADRHGLPSNTVLGEDLDKSLLFPTSLHLPQQLQSQLRLLFEGGISSASGSGSFPAAGPLGEPSSSITVEGQMPTDLNTEMFTEDLDCDVDYIIKSDLMDGEDIDFNYDPMLPVNQSYPATVSTPDPSVSWVPSQVISIPYN